MPLPAPFDESIPPPDFEVMTITEGDHPNDQVNASRFAVLVLFSPQNCRDNFLHNASKEAVVMKWVRSFDVPSSTGDGSWTVSQGDDQSWGCSCPQWRFRKQQECKHIRRIKDRLNAGPVQPRPRILELIVAQVPEVTQASDAALLVPVIPPNDVHVLVTVAFDLYAWGVPWATIKDRYQLSKTYTKEECFRYIQTHGRKRLREGGHKAPTSEIVQSWPLPTPLLPNESADAYHLRTGYPLDLARLMICRMPAMNAPLPMPRRTRPSRVHSTETVAIRPTRRILVDDSPPRPSLPTHRP